MPFIKPSDRTRMLWGRLVTWPLVLDLTTLLFAQPILVAALANFLPVFRHSAGLDRCTDPLYIPPSAVGNFTDIAPDESIFILHHYPILPFAVPSLAFVFAVIKIALYSEAALRPKLALGLSLISLVGWALVTDIWWALGTTVQWKTETATPVVISFVFPWEIMFLGGGVSVLIDFIYVIIAGLAATVEHKHSMAKSRRVSSSHDEGLLPVYHSDIHESSDYRDESAPTPAVHAPADGTRRISRPWLAWSPNYTFHAPGWRYRDPSPSRDSDGEEQPLCSSSPASPRSPGSTRTASLSDVVTIMSGSVISDSSSERHLRDTLAASAELTAAG